MSYKLKAVNRCLRAIGETPVNSLNSGVPDAEDAATIVDETTESVLDFGWHCNTAFNVRLIPNLDKHIIVPSNALRIDTSGVSASINVTIATDPSDNIRKLFVIPEQTFVIEQSVYVDITYLFDIDHLPFALQNYISAKAARVFQASSMSSLSLDQFTAHAESEAWAKLMDAEAEAEDSNSLRDSDFLRYVTFRNNPISQR